MKSKGMTRKGFVAASVAAAGLCAAGSALAGEAAAAAPVWDESYDVVVAGSGTAVVAGLTAAKNGAKTLLVEKSDITGGTSCLSGGGFWLPGNKLEVEEGIEEDEEPGIQYGLACAEAWGGYYDEDVVRSYVKWGLEMWDMMEQDLGYAFTIDPHATADYFNIDGQLSRGRAAGFAKEEGQTINDIWQRMVSDAEGFGLEVRTGCPALSLVLDGGRVAGVVVNDNGTEKRIEAKLGVILGTGGIDHNDKMCKSFLREKLYHSTAASGDTGDGQRMGASVGASLVNMQSAWGAPMVLTDEDTETYACDWGLYRAKPGCIIVNSFGERFCDEATAYPIIGRTFGMWDNGRDVLRNDPAYEIFDDGYAQHYNFPGGSELGEMPAAMVSADTLEELAEKIGIDPETLCATVERFNVFARAGHDDDWCRGDSAYDQSPVAGDASRTELANPSLGALETAPFYAIKVFSGAIGTAGGLEINGDAQVLDTEGNVIEGLYAVGNCSGSIFGGAYPGPGGTVGPGIVMAYAAATTLTK